MLNLKCFQLDFLFHLIKYLRFGLILICHQGRPTLHFFCTGLEIFQPSILKKEKERKKENLPCTDRSSTSFDLLSSRYSRPEQCTHTNFTSMSNITNFVLDSVLLTLNISEFLTLQYMLLGKSLTFTSLAWVAWNYNL